MSYHNSYWAEMEFVPKPELTKQQDAEGSLSQSHTSHVCTLRNAYTVHFLTSSLARAAEIWHIHLPSIKMLFLPVRCVCTLEYS